MREAAARGWWRGRGVPGPARTPHPLDIIRAALAEPLARRSRRNAWAHLLTGTRSSGSMNLIDDVLIVEGVGGIMVPMDAKHTMLDVAQWLKLPAVVVRPEPRHDQSHAADRRCAAGREGEDS